MTVGADCSTAVDIPARERSTVVLGHRRLVQAVAHVPLAAAHEESS